MLTGWVLNSHQEVEWGGSVPSRINGVVIATMAVRSPGRDAFVQAECQDGGGLQWIKGSP